MTKIDGGIGGIGFLDDRYLRLAGGTITGALTVVGLATFSATTDSIEVAQRIVHDGDANTYIEFTNDQIDFFAGNLKFMTFDEGIGDSTKLYTDGTNAAITINTVLGISTLTFNEDSIDLDIRMESNNNTAMFFLNSGTNRIGINTSLPICTFDLNGGFAANLVAKTANYTATTSDHTIICGAGNETFTVTLMAASGVTGFILNIKNIGTGTITVDANGSETIDGATTNSLSAQYDSITIQSDGTEWWIL